MSVKQVLFRVSDKFHVRAAKLCGEISAYTGKTLTPPMLARIAFVRFVEGVESGDIDDLFVTKIFADKNRTSPAFKYNI